MNKFEVGGCSGYFCGCKAPPYETLNCKVGKSDFRVEMLGMHHLIK